MHLDELAGKYKDLRNELDAAYSDPVWDSNRINRIADEMVPVERALATYRSAAVDGSGASHA